MPVTPSAIWIFTRMPQKSAARFEANSRLPEDREWMVASLDRKCLGVKMPVRGGGPDRRDIFDKETRRKPLGFAADAAVRSRAAMEKEWRLGSGLRDDKPISIRSDQATLTVDGVG